MVGGKFVLTVAFLSVSWLLSTSFCSLREFNKSVLFLKQLLEGCYKSWNKARDQLNVVVSDNTAGDSSKWHAFNVGSVLTPVT